MEIESNPERKPDFGPAHIGPAGATAIGARQPLIAFNVYLNTEDVSVAKAIAKSIRHSSGGLPYVKALGMLVEGKAQVSLVLDGSDATVGGTALSTARLIRESYATRVLEEQAALTGRASFLVPPLDVRTQAGTTQT